MVKKIGGALKSFFTKRTNILLLIFLAMSGILFARLFDLQIIRGKSYAENFDLITTRTRMIKSSRGNIYDVKGRPLAWNELANSVVIEDNGSYESMREKNLALNGEILELTRLIRAKGDEPYMDFHVVLDENGDYAFDLEEGRALDRFRADVFGHAYIEDLKPEERVADAAKVIEFLSSEDMFALTSPEERPYTEEELQKNRLPAELTKEETLDILVFRYQLNLVSYQRYLPVTVAKDVSDETVAAVEERSNELQGVSIAEDYTRRYVDSDAIGPILGYTGKPSAEELEELMELDPNYSASTVIGKAGLEQYFETELQGTDGMETVTINNVGKILSIDNESRVEPKQGNDIYLSIDLELQDALYKIIEQRVAGILLTNLEFIKESEITEDNDMITVPVYDIYNALVANNLIDLEHLYAADATEVEKRVLARIEDRNREIVHWLTQELSSVTPRKYEDLSKEQRVYMSYIASNFLTQREGIINDSLVDRTDPVYIAYYQTGEISFREYLLHAINEGWVSLPKLGEEGQYLDSEEVFYAVIAYVQEHLPEDRDFVKRMFRFLLLSDSVSPKDLCLILYEQGYLEKTDVDYPALVRGDLPPDEFVSEKVRKLELTPSALALDPNSGSAVVTDPSTGRVEACVSYPGYNSNYLANQLDEEYFARLSRDASSPFYNKATQQLTAPGSTFKPIIAAAGLTEGVIDNDTRIECRGHFGGDGTTDGDVLYCALRTGHGFLEIVPAIAFSCNVYFCTVGFRLGMLESGGYREQVALRYIRRYATSFGLDKPSGIEMPESDPHISTALAIASSIGQGEHQYTTVQLAKYVGMIATKGKGYDLTLLDRETDAEGVVINENEPKLTNTLDLDPSVWNTIHEGMYSVTDYTPMYVGLNLRFLSKTGTAQDDLTRPSHALSIGFTDEDDKQNIAVTVRIPNGYSSFNAVLLTRDILEYYYNIREEADLITGEADTSNMTRELMTD